MVYITSFEIIGCGTSFHLVVFSDYFRPCITAKSLFNLIDTDLTGIYKDNFILSLL